MFVLLFWFIPIVRKKCYILKITSICISGAISFAQTYKSAWYKLGEKYWNFEYLEWCRYLLLSMNWLISMAYEPIQGSGLQPFTYRNDDNNFSWILFLFLYAHQWKLFQISSDIGFVNPIIRQADLSSTSVPVFMYEFTFKGAGQQIIPINIPSKWNRLKVSYILLFITKHQTKKIPPLHMFQSASDHLREEEKIILWFCGDSLLVVQTCMEVLMQRFNFIKHACIRCTKNDKKFKTSK